MKTPTTPSSIPISSMSRRRSPGQVIAIHVNDNQLVRRGQPLVEHRSRRTQQAQAGAGQAQGAAGPDPDRAGAGQPDAARWRRRHNASRDLARYRSLQATNPQAVAQQQVDQAWPPTAMPAPSVDRRRGPGRRRQGPDQDARGPDRHRPDQSGLCPYRRAGGRPCRPAQRRAGQLCHAGPGTDDHRAAAIVGDGQFQGNPARPDAAGPAR